MLYRVAPLLLCLVVIAPARAQGNLPSERASLSGVGSFGVQTTVEGPSQLAESDLLAAEVLAERITERLRKSGLPITSQSVDKARIHLHLNMMELENGLVPFSAELHFMQAARLRRSGHDMSVVTWNESVLGLVSYDLLTTIASSVDELVDQFARDFESANR